MRNGDSYKIKSLAKQGVSESDIIHKFRNSYTPEEVRQFLPSKPAKAVATPVAEDKPKAKKRKARTTRKPT